MIAFLDCYIISPINHSINEFVCNHPQPFTYHFPAQNKLEDIHSLPKEPTGIIVLGSASNVTENLDWHKKILDYVIPKLESGIPVLGICFGHQLIASHYGCEINNAVNNETNFREAREIIFKDPVLNYKTGDKIVLPYYHQQIIKKRSEDIIELAYSERFSNEIISHKKYPFIGTQAHPEASMKFLSEESLIKKDLVKVQNYGHKFIQSSLDHFHQ